MYAIIPRCNVLCIRMLMTCILSKLRNKGKARNYYITGSYAPRTQLLLTFQKLTIRFVITIVDNILNTNNLIIVVYYLQTFDGKIRTMYVSQKRKTKHYDY